MQYHIKYPSHGYRWLNAKIRLDMSIIFSENYAHKCCKYSGIKSKIRKKYKYKSSERQYIYPNLLIKDLNITAQLQVIVSDMTAFWVKATYYELTLYVDLFNNEIISYAVSTIHGDNKTYIKGRDDLLEIKKEHPVSNISYNLKFFQIDSYNFYMNF